MIKFKSQKPASILLITLFILSGVFMITFAVGYMTMIAVKAGDSQAQSFRAYYAAEAGEEKTRYEIKTNPNIFTACPGGNIFGTSTLLNNASYLIDCLSASSPYSFVASGNYKKVHRDLEFSYTVLVVIPTSTPSSTQTFAPSTLSGLAMWLNAGSGVATATGNYVTSWNDQSNNGNNVTQGSQFNQPILVSGALNGNPVVRFDGNNDYLNGGSSIGNIPLTGASFFIVGKSHTNQGAFVSKSAFAAADARYSVEYDPQWQGGFSFLYVEDNNSTYHSVNMPSHSYGNMDLMAAIADKPNSVNHFYINSALAGTSALSSTYSMTSPYDFLVGAYNSSNGGGAPIGGYFLNGDIAEIIMYNRALSDTERGQVESYLNTKYAIY